MTTLEFLAHLRRLEINLWADGDRLRYSAPQGALTPALRAELSARKTEILEFLRRTQAKPLSITPASREQNLPLSFAQQRLWFFDQLEPDSPTYNETTAFRLTGWLNLAALEQSLGDIVRRHKSLRTNFVALGGQPAQIINDGPRGAWTIPVIELQHLPPVEREAEARRLASVEVRRPFNLAQGPLLRISLFRLAEAEHVLVLVMHHIITDGWSMEVLFRELALLYEAYTTDLPASLPDLPIQYADFAVWQRQWLQGEILERQLAYWRQHLGNHLPTLELPTDRPRPAVQTFRGATPTLRLPQDLSEALQALSQQAGVTLFMTLLAAFKTLLYRYTGQDDIVVGLPIANRNRSELEGLIGFFVNTLVLRTDLTGNPTFWELLSRVRETMLGAEAHQDLPFEKLVEVLHPERDLGRNPLFQVAFSPQSSLPTIELAGLTASPFAVETGVTKFELTLYMTDTPQGLLGMWEYNSDLFDAVTITRMLGHYQTLLEGIVADADQRLSDLPLLTPAERQQLLAEWNATGSREAYAPDLCLHALIEAQVERTPDAIAVIFNDEILTYRELNRRSNQLAHYLQALGVGPEVLVGICLENSVEMVVAVLGVLKAGGAYIPQDPAYPPERIAFVLSDAQAPVLLTQRHLVERLPKQGAQLVCLDTDWATIATEPDENPRSGVTLDDLAYVIYTSGSTGQPKGVMISHRAIGNHMQWLQTAFPLTEADAVLQKTPVSFDASVWEFYAPLLTGARLVVARPDGHAEPAYLVKTIIERQVTILQLVPSLLQLLLQEPEFAACTCLKRVFCGGEPLTPELVARFYAQLSADLVNLYGPTEATIDATFWVCPREGQPRIVPIGYPIANMRAYILDPHLQPVPVGVRGELYLGGVGLARGYLNRPDLTAEKFIPHPFRTTADGRPPSAKPPCPEPKAPYGRGAFGSGTAAAESSTFSGLPSVVSSRLYKTGDLARYLSDGAIEFFGRMDHQVKIRGFRLELGEIEAALRHHPAMRDAVVLARSDKYGPSQKQLVAYLVADPERRPTIGELRSFLKQTLPDYMIPSSFVFLEALPLTPNGKVDRHALPVPNQQTRLDEKTLTPPRNQIEQRLAEIWARVLQIEQVGVHDNFFELGGDSILSIQIIARANQAGLRLTPRQFFQHQTIAELAAVADTALVTSAEQGLVTGPVPLTPIQHWFFEQNLPEPQHWNQAMLLEAKQPLNPALLEQAVQSLLAHHDALRLRFYPSPSPPGSGGEREGSGWRQINADLTESTPFTRIDLSAHSLAETRAVIEAAAAELQASLNLAEGPLVRVALFDLGPEQPNRLLIVIHHLAIDGVSWRILLEDLQTACQQFERGEAIPLPAKTTSYKQWAERLAEAARKRASDATGQAELAYWLAEPPLPIPPLPLDYPEGRSANTEASARTVAVVLNTEETRALLQDVPATYRTQINDVLLTALVQALAGWTGTPALRLDLEGHGREEIVAEVDLSRTVGWFTTIFPVSLDLRAAPQPGEALKSMKEQLRRIPEHGIGYGLWRYLSEDPAIVSQLHARPQAEVSFNYLGQFDQVLAESALFRLARESSGPDHSPRGQRRYVLEVEGSIMEGWLQVAWVYSENMHRRSTIERLAEDFITALRALISHCQSSQAGSYTPSDFPEANLSQAELDDLLAELSEMTE